MKLRQVSFIAAALIIVLLLAISLLPTLNKARMPAPSASAPKESSVFRNDQKTLEYRKEDEKSEFDEVDDLVSAPSSEELKKAAPKQEEIVNVDYQLESLNYGTAAFNTPKKISYKSTELIHLLLSPQEKDEVVSKLVEGSGSVSSESVRFSKFMEARIEGAGFQINAVSSARQPISLTEPTEWRWQVTPVAGGRQSLYLSLYAVIVLEGEKHERLLKTFTREMLVDIKFLEYPLEFMKHKPSLTVLSLGTVFCILLFGAGFMKIQRRKKASGQAISIGGVEGSVDIFISYSSKDREYSSNLVDKLRRRGLKVWMDVGGIAPAALWSTEIVTALKSAKLVVLVGSVNSFASHNVVKEVSLASEQQTPIVPLIIDDSEIPDKLAYQLAGVQVLRSDRDDVDKSVEEIVQIAGIKRT